MRTFRIVSLGLILSLLQISAADRILFLLPIASKSIVNIYEPLIRALGERGHEIVNISPVKLPSMPSTVQQVQIVTVQEIFGEMANPFEMRRMGKLEALMNGNGFDSLNQACIKVLKSDAFQDILTKEKFDVIIVDILMNFCVTGAVHVLNAPTILVTSFAAPSYISNSIGNRLPPSFVVDAFFLDFTHKMNFVQRLTNIVLGSLLQAGAQMLIESAEQMYKEHLPNGKDLPGVFDILSNTSMVFMNSHFTLNFPRPLLPDCIEVGGMHTRPAKPLPKEIDDFLTGSGENGFIFFSLGSIVPANVMPDEYRKTFLRVFSRLKQRVIWKWETETMPETMPPNVMLRKWLPQQDILGHPNIKLFMTHGGLLSTQEAVYHGVPLLGFPIFGDQDLNIKQAEGGGYAKLFEILDMEEDNLERAISEMLNNPSYFQKAKQLSNIVRDLPETPLEKAVFWSEYIIRHHGAPHLRSAARDLNFFQYYLIDVAIAIFFIAFTVLYLFYVIARTIFRMICGKSNSSKLPAKTKTQ